MGTNAEKKKGTVLYFLQVRTSTRSEGTVRVPGRLLVREPGKTFSDLLACQIYACFDRFLERGEGEGGVSSVHYVP